jgi:hypothetical protein
LEHETELHRVISALISKQRKLVSSTHLWERFGVLWTAALLDEQLSQCSDLEIGDLMLSVQERFGIFEPEFALCHHARCRLMLRNAKEQLTK